MSKKAIEMYGMKFPSEWNRLEIELHCMKINVTPEHGGLGQVGHFRNVVDIIWNRPDSPKPFLWHPWALRMIEYAFKYPELAIGGCAGSGKSDCMAVYGIVQYLASPDDTIVLFTSTSLKDSKKRVWGTVVEYWNAAPGLPGQLAKSLGIIRGADGSEKKGLALIAGEKKHEKEAVGKMIGFHNRRVFLIADELSELSEAILEAAYGNLSANPHFEFKSMSNPSSHHDPFGRMSKPKAGWESVNDEMDEWETERGWCIRFDGRRSPNILAGEVLYDFLPTEEKNSAYELNSPMYYRMVVGFWSPTGNKEGVFSDADIVKFKADAKVVWAKPPIRVAALDPSFSSGGDRAILYFGWYGISDGGLPTLCYDKYEQLFIDKKIKDEPPSYQVVRKFRDRCMDEGVTPENAAYDSTGAGGPFGDIVDQEWSDKVMRVPFNGKASERPVSFTDRTKACDRYVNKVSEIWFSGREYMRSGQIKGVGNEMAREMVSRIYTTIKGSTMRIQVESKDDMIKRVGRSPDIADAAFILLDLVRERHSMAPKRGAESQKATRDRRRKRARRLDVAGLSGHTLQR